MNNLENVLQCPMIKNDVEAKTIGEYIFRLLYTLWEEGESFSAKRPFGNSGWEYSIYASLVKRGIVSGEYTEEYNELTEFDAPLANELVFQSIEYVFKKYI